MDLDSTETQIESAGLLMPTPYASAAANCEDRHQCTVKSVAPTMLARQQCIAGPVPLFMLHITEFKAC